MKISTKGRYGLRALVELTACSSGQAVPLLRLTENQKLSQNYLEQVFQTLRKAGIVTSIKGMNGGYLLAERRRRSQYGRCWKHWRESFLS